MSEFASAKRAFLGRAFSAIAENRDVRNAFAEYVAGLELERAGAMRVMVHLGETGVAWWRAFIPFCELARSRNFDIRMSTTISPDDLRWADVLWLQRPGRTVVVDVLTKWMPIFGRARVVVDNDDWLRNVPSYNPFAGRIATEGISEAFDRALELADRVTFSTAELARLYNRPDAAILPNAVDADVWHLNGHSIRPSFPICIGWAGSPTHSADLALVEPAIAEVMKRRSDVAFVRVGAFGVHTAGELRSLPRDRVFELGFEPHAHELAKYLRGLDVGICPLVANAFNRAKSNCKWLECAALGVPTVASRVGPYDDTVGSLVVDNDVDAWIGALEYLITTEHRKTFGQAAAAEVAEQGTIQRTIAKWVAVLTETV